MLLFSGLLSKCIENNEKNIHIILEIFAYFLNAFSWNFSKSIFLDDLLWQYSTFPIFLNISPNFSLLKN